MYRQSGRFGETQFLETNLFILVTNQFLLQFNKVNEMRICVCVHVDCAGHDLGSIIIM
jgi:hypothetical protein